MSDSRADANDFTTHLISPSFFPHSFLFFEPLLPLLQSPAHTSETSAERLALACERVHADNAMHYVFTGICMKCSRCHSCQPVIWWQYFKGGAGAGEEGQSKEDTSATPIPTIARAAYMKQPVTSLRPEKNIKRRGVSDLSALAGATVWERRTTKWPVLMRRRFCFFLPRRDAGKL